MSGIVLNLHTTANDVIVRGKNCFFARWTGVGVIPPGMNWVGMEKGVRFWGTPRRSGSWRAEFEGPYPANFYSELTFGGSDAPPIQLDGGDIPENIVVNKFIINFTVSESQYTFGQALKELSSNPSVGQTARRLAWAGERCIGMLGLSEAIAESSVPRPVELRSAKSLSGVAANLAALINLSGVATASVSGLTVAISGLEVGALTISASSSVQGGISTVAVKQGTSTEKQVTNAILSGAFKGGVTYSVTVGEGVYSVLTEVEPKGGLYTYQDQVSAINLNGRPVRNDDITAEDCLAGDWVFGFAPVIDRSFDRCLLTTGFLGNSPSVDSRVLVNAAIPV